MGKDKNRINPRLRQFPKDPGLCFHPNLIESQKGPKAKFNKTEFETKLEIKLDRLAKQFSEKVGGVMETMEAKAIDCYLYSKDNKYLTNKP